MYFAGLPKYRPSESQSLITKEPAPIRECLPTLIILIILTDIFISAKSSIKVNPPVVKLGFIST